MKRAEFHIPPFKWPAKKIWILAYVLCFTAGKVVEDARRSVGSGPAGKTSRIDSPKTMLTYSFTGLGWTRPECNSDTVPVESGWNATPFS
jgi:hypothetical protein